MLVLTRKANESLSIDWLGRPELGVAMATVLSISGNRVKLGLDGPRDVRFLRSELKTEPGPSLRAADVLAHAANVLVAGQAGLADRDAILLDDAAQRLLILAGEQP